MDCTAFYKSVLEQDDAPVVLCDLEHRILYMNPAAIRRYETKGGASLVGTCLFDCHNPHSVECIKRVVSWFAESKTHNRVYTFHNEKENKDVYMIALRDADGTLIGYYEKHSYRNAETAQLYDMD